MPFPPVPLKAASVNVICKPVVVESGVVKSASPVCTAALVVSSSAPLPLASIGELALHAAIEVEGVALSPAVKHASPIADHAPGVVLSVVNGS
jgi:hypothetical protein